MQSFGQEETSSECEMLFRRLFEGDSGAKVAVFCQKNGASIPASLLEIASSIIFEVDRFSEYLPFSFRLRPECTIKAPHRTAAVDVRALVPLGRLPVQSDANCGGRQPYRPTEETPAQ